MSLQASAVVGFLLGISYISFENEVKLIIMKKTYRKKLNYNLKFKHTARS